MQRSTKSILMSMSNRDALMLRVKRAIEDAIVGGMEPEAVEDAISELLSNRPGKITTIIHVNQHRIKSNAKTGERQPVLTVKTYNKNQYGHEAIINGPCKVVYRPDKPLSCGAKVWIETKATVDVVIAECDHNEMIERKDDKDHAWQCAKCGHVFAMNPPPHSSLCNTISDEEMDAREQRDAAW